MASCDCPPDYRFISQSIKSITRRRALSIGKGDEIRGVRAGEILVTKMTSVKCASIIPKIAAIVTDDGGRLCHAAILSREFKIPCIVGTKIATKVLKDGDLVEVDAEKGVVRTLRSA